MDFTEDCFNTGWLGEHSSVIPRWTILKSVLNRLVGEAFFRYTAVDCIEGCLLQVGGGAVFSYTALDCTEVCFIQFGRGEQCSGILQWTLPKTVLYMLLGGTLFRYTAVDCTGDYLI